ncbi:hypothetical protein [Cyanothece sp. BG0011]|uniref:hypothetical protein n=1 Tax=Cyanothece sp. BG0011 TaxID=2082950 RepID=UPI000D1F52C3|nr:hypothetical protein [Cyanothece sp. BG0011]
MTLDLTYDALFTSFAIENDKIILAKADLLRMVLGIPLTVTDWLIVIHECLRRTFLSYLIVDENDILLKDNQYFVVSDYSQVYAHIDCITLGKRATFDSIVLGYQWKFTTIFESTTNKSLSLVEINDNNVLINLDALNFPSNPVDFCQAFVNYLAVNEAENIKVDTNYLVEFFFSNNLPLLRLEDIIDG